MKLSRRDFLGRSAGSVTLAAASWTFPEILARTAAAATRFDAGGRILVMVQLTGGNDGLNTVVPIRDEMYRQLRPTLAIKRDQALRLSDDVGLCPQLRGLMDLYNDGMLSVVQGVGYPNPNRSHFESLDIWHCADPSRANLQTGWLGRVLEKDHTCQALHLDDAPLPLALRAEKADVPSVASIENFRLEGDANAPSRRAIQKMLERDQGIKPSRDQATEAEGDQGGSPKGYQGAPRESQSKIQNPKSKIDAPLVREPLVREPLVRESLLAPDSAGILSGTFASDLQFIRRTAVSACENARRLEALPHDAGGGYPSYGLATRLRQIARLIAADFGPRIFYTSLGGFDTHARQNTLHPDLMSELGGSVAAFYADLREKRLADRVLLMTFSEFGRRAAENASLGTDHGAAAPLFIAGPAAKGDIIGPTPDLSKLVDDDVPHAIDFRRVYATLLDGWLNVPSREILGAGFERLSILR